MVPGVRFGVTPRLLCAIGLTVSAGWSASAQGRAEGKIEGDPVVRVIGRDRIHSIDHPKMITVEKADAVMPDHAPVLGVTDGTRSRAYPIWVLDEHEIVNDWLGEVPIAATW